MPHETTFQRLEVETKPDIIRKLLCLLMLTGINYFCSTMSGHQISLTNNVIADLKFNVFLVI